VADLCNGGFAFSTLYAPVGSGGPEDAPKAFDNNFTTSKWLTAAPGEAGPNPPEIWARAQLSGGAAVIVSYTVTSANDEQYRDPRDWTLSGSNDGSTWTVLDTRTNEVFATRFLSKNYNFSNSTAYAYYRWDVQSTYYPPLCGKFQTAGLDLWTGAGGTGTNKSLGATITASFNQGSGTEGSDFAFDGSASTKWHASNLWPTTGSGLSAYIVGYKLTAAAAIDWYTITSGNDNLTIRDPADWKLQGSNDGLTWTDADSRTGETFPSNNFTKTYTFFNSVGSFVYWRLLITKKGDGTSTGTIQINEIEMDATGVAAPNLGRPVLSLWPLRGPMHRLVQLFNFDLPVTAVAEITGTFAITEAADVAAFVGDVVIAAALATTEATDVAAFNGTVTTLTGTLAVTEAPDVAAFAGSVAWTATLATTEAADVAAFNGTVTWTATLATTEAADIAAFNGSAAWTGTLATTEAPDIVAFNGQVVIAASLVTTENQDVASFLGSGVDITATLATTEATDVAAFVGQAVISAVLATVEATDSAAFAGGATWTGTLATTEAKDVMAFTGSAGWTGTLAVTEGTDVAAFAGQVRISAALAVTEAQDVAAFNGFLVAPLTGTLAVTEAKDVANFSGFLVFAGIVGALDAVERADGARFVVAQPPATPGDLQYGWPDVIVRRRL
jgi:hypothetical protein